MILDLDNDGIPFMSRSSGVAFDLDADGKPERVGWTQAGARDGFLVFDLDGDFRIANGAEMVGSRLRMPDGSSPRNGLRALIALQQGVEFDENGKATRLPPKAGMLDKDDAVYAHLAIWLDLNHDGVSGPGELQSLSDSSIAEISLGMQGRAELHNGTEVFMAGSFLLAKRGVNFRRTMLEVRLAR
jgi:hypothetical protein